jgi:regulator of CtrA degradation
MSGAVSNSADPVVLAKRLAAGPSFTALFREGMALVESTAAYLDGPGRKEAKALERSAALTYATESMRLTTRLMQLASWLLLQRAVNEGELTFDQARTEKMKVKLSSFPPLEKEFLEALPKRLGALISDSRRLHEQVLRLDALVYGGTSVAAVEAAHSQSNPVETQLGLLKAAFGNDN